MSEKLVSLLVPSSNRSDFEKCLERLRDTCSNHSAVEILVKIDHEGEIPHYKELLSKFPFDHKVTYSALTGYLNIGTFQNELAAQASGKLLWPFNDNFYIRHGDWISELEKTTHIYQDKIYAIHIACGDNRHWFSLGPIITKEWFQCLGYLAISYMEDYWVSLVARDLNRFVVVPSGKLHIDHITIPKVTKAQNKALHKVLFKELPKAVSKLRTCMRS